MPSKPYLQVCQGLMQCLRSQTQAVISSHILMCNNIVHSHAQAMLMAMHTDKACCNAAYTGQAQKAAATPFHCLTGGTSRQVTSGRDTSLMQLLGPLLAGNARTFLLAAVSAQPKDYLETMSTLRLAVRAQKIQVCCHTAGHLYGHVCHALSHTCKL